MVVPWGGTKQEHRPPRISAAKHPPKARLFSTCGNAGDVVNTGRTQGSTVRELYAICTTELCAAASCALSRVNLENTSQGYVLSFTTYLSSTTTD